MSGSVGQSGSSRNKKSIAAGSEVVVECAGQWRQEVDVTASFLRGAKDWQNLQMLCFFLQKLGFFCKSTDGQSVKILSQMGRTGSISDAMASLEGRGSGSLPRWRTTVGGHR